MSNIIALTKVLIKNNIFGFSSKKNKGKNGKSGSPVAYLILLVFCIAIVALPIIISLKSILASYDLSELILSFTMPIGAITSIFFGVFTITSVFYFNKDSEQLLPLPIKSHELLIAKFITSLVSLYLMLLMFAYPLIIGVGIGTNASIVYYIYSLVIFILMPVIPSCIMAIIIMLLNKAFNFGKHKDLFMYITTAFIFIFAFIYTFGVDYLFDDDSSLLSAVSGDNSSLLKTSKYIFPFFNSATYALVNYREFIGLAALVTFIGINVIFMLLLSLIGNKLYIKGLAKNSGASTSKKESLEKIYKSSKGGVIRELIKKEWLMIKRSPTFMLNVVISNLMFPLILIVSFAIGYASSGTEIDLLTSYIDFSNSGVLLIAIGVLMILSSLSSTTSTAISREGNGAWMMKTIPVSLKKQMDAKVYFSLSLDVAVLLIIEIVLMIVFKPPFIYLILVNLPLILIILIANYLFLILDLRKPKLDWSDETEAVKQNFNVFFAMIIVSIISVALIVIGVILTKRSINIYLLFTIISVVLLVSYACLMKIISKKQDKLFNKVG